MKYRHFFFLVIIVIVLGSLSSAEKFGYGRTEDIPINYSTIPSVNNSEYLDGYSVDSLYTYYRGLLETYFDTVYCKLTGCTMAGNIDMDGNDITNAGTITADSFIGDGSQLTGINSTASSDNIFYEYYTSSRNDIVIENLSDSDQAIVEEIVQPGEHYVYGGYLE